MNTPTPDTNFPTEQMLGFYRDMLRIRRVEEQIGKDAKAGNIPGAVHLYIGQEAVGVGFCSQLTDDDWIASTHRGHGHYLAKGGDTNLLMAEIYGRETGICKGHGGSMHVADFSKGIIGANGIVGAGISITTGAAWAAQLDGKGAVGVAFFGDGAANQGGLCEALNVSVLWNLPVIFVCENNGFSEFSPSATVTAGNIVDRAKPYGAAHEAVDGNDLIAVHQSAGRAIKRARDGDGPTLMIRADMDALPLEEKTGLPYSSTVVAQDYFGQTAPVMHACAHDSHMAILIGTARRLVAMKDQWSGTLELVNRPCLK